MKASECPYCKIEMISGIIHGDRYPLKWIPDIKDKGAFLAPFTKGIKLTNMLETNSISAFYCEGCNKVIMDLKRL